MSRLLGLAASLFGSAASASQKASSTTRTVYIVRHAESRWNAAWKRLNVPAMLSEVDHGLSITGVDQAATLAASLVRPPVALGETGAVMASSPLCRALQTALVAIDASGVRTPPPVLVLPNARESGGSFGFGRDSTGTPTAEIVQNVVRELCASGASRVAAALRRGHLALDLSRLGVEQQWWGHAGRESERARLQALLGELYALAAPPPAATAGTPLAPRVVVVSHSYLMRNLLRDHVDEASAFARSAQRAELASTKVGNCRVLALELKRDHGGDDVVTIVGAHLLPLGGSLGRMRQPDAADGESLDTARRAGG